MAPPSPEERAQIVANNKSLRIIKNGILTSLQELESLAERGILTDDMYDTIMSSLPAEAPLRAGAGGSAFAASTNNTPALRSEAVASPPPAVPNPTLTSSFANMSVSNPSLPPRNPTPAAAPAPPPRKPEIAHAIALYEYRASDSGDLALMRDDHISVTEYMNAEWWSGVNVRTGSEGIFPKNYVRVEPYPSALSAAAPPPQYNEKASYTPQPQYNGGGYPGQPIYGQPQQQQNPYNNSVPPMAVANDGSGQQQGAVDPSGGGKGKDMAKKFGGKLGNAAIFGAGATIGGNIVNSIF